MICRWVARLRRRATTPKTLSDCCRPDDCWWPDCPLRRGAKT